MSLAAKYLQPQPRFRVRDVSAEYGLPCFDIVYADEEAGVERYSESVWHSEAEAMIQASMLEAANARPAHWDVI